MGELDSTRFREITKSKFLGTDANLKATQFCSMWEHHLVDPNWHPFKDVTRENGSKVIMHYYRLIVLFHIFIPLNQNT
uniref:XH/XS domain-containing protein n=1 Tax=Solanum tuberosum TaxID=4113 RepID=M0ZZA1_SOLTU